MGDHIKRNSPCNTSVNRLRTGRLGAPPDSTSQIVEHRGARPLRHPATLRKDRESSAEQHVPGPRREPHRRGRRLRLLRAQPLVALGADRSRSARTPAVPSHSRRGDVVCGCASRPLEDGAPVCSSTLATRRDSSRSRTTPPRRPWLRRLDQLGALHLASTRSRRPHPRAPSSSAAETPRPRRDLPSRRRDPPCRRSTRPDRRRGSAPPTAGSHNPPEQARHMDDRGAKPREVDGAAAACRSVADAQNDQQRHATEAHG